MTTGIRAFPALCGSAVLVLLAGCSAGPATADTVAQKTPVAEKQARKAPPKPAMAGSAMNETASFIIDGKLTQGGWIRGTVPAGTASALLDGQLLALDAQGRFFAAFDRDSGSNAVLTARTRNGQTITRTLSVSPRSWNIEHINAARKTGGPSETFMQRRRPELAQINAARAVNAQSDGWSQNFIWPAKGRISGRFGSQRIYRGEPGSYHTGLDIATGTSGTPFVAPADGVVVLAAQTPFSLEGYLLMIDHGQGLNSAFLHCSKIAVKKGDVVKQGQYIGNIGASGRATGPHLHWSIKWKNNRLDPLLFLDPMN
ncbi:MAG: peptidoglycan DD-metalloendopeptidase family protein [Sphingomonadaceae bacterium]